MADTSSYSKSKRLVSGRPSQKPPNQEQNLSKFYTNFLYKALFFTVFLVIIPLFPSQAPEFINQTAFTRSWELIQLLVVGIAVSYGLFSRKNDETDKENHSKFDNAQTYVSRFLQVASVFEDEALSPSGYDENKIQTWNNQYFRGEPVVVVAKENPVLDEQTGSSSRIIEKPLLLPVRSLKPSISDSNIDLSSVSMSDLGSKRFSKHPNKTRSAEFRYLDTQDFEEKVEENVVLRSPIPWRSRSGRMELKREEEEEESVNSPPLYSLPPAMEESDFSRLEALSFRSQSSWPSRPNSTSSPRNLSPSPSLSSSESQTKSVEDFVKKKKSLYKSYSSPPPPPPPPPPPLSRKSPSISSNSRPISNWNSYERDFERSFRGESGVSSKSKGENSVRKSVRTVRGNETVLQPKKSKEIIDDGIQELSSGNHSILSKPAFKELSKEKKKEIEEKVFVETESHDEDFESGEEDIVGLINGEAASNKSDTGPDVDKKADEFIAKFREQIRLQRIDSIKRSSQQLSRNSSR